MKNNILASIRNRISPTPPAPISAGIYHNSILGLISLSSDGENWTTMSDKNLGATAVYNDGDTLSQTNCGNYFQWGNNYGFPRTGSVTTGNTQVDATNYGPYYDSNLFVTPPDGLTRESSGNRNLWGGITNTVEAMQGPCKEGYHVPNSTEMTSLVNIMSSFGFTKGTQYAEYIKLPLAGRRNSNNGTVGLQGSYGIYRISTNDGGAYMRDLYMSSNNAYCGQNGSAATGSSIRPFKNIIVVPDNTRTVLYQGTGDAGIFWNEVQGIISLSSDGTTWLTIADKNLGATTVYNYGDTLSEANCGGYFQWGNNYMTHFTGYADGSTSHPINAANYGPYYYSNIFIIDNDDWSSVNNNNLWGGVTNTNIARQGPCSEGFHVPSNNENGGLISTLSALGIDTNNGNGMRIYLKMPFAGYRHFYNSEYRIYEQGSSGDYLSSTSYNTDRGGMNYIILSSSRLINRGGYSRCYGFSIRPFKNTSIVPDSTRTKLF